MNITAKSFMNSSLRAILVKRIKTFGEDYFSKNVEENAISQLEIKDEYFSNLINTPHFSNAEIDAILEINV